MIIILIIMIISIILLMYRLKCHSLPYLELKCHIIFVSFAVKNEHSFLILIMQIASKM